MGWRFLRWREWSRRWSTAGSKESVMSRRLLFLFGAGASYGAGGTLPEQPPLGTQLFDVLERQFPSTWGRLPGDVAAQFRNNFEMGMRVVYDSFGMAVPQLMRDMAIFFIQFRPYLRRTLYCRLIDDLRKTDKLNESIFSTLNYDCVLEFSMSEAKVPFSYFDAVGETICPLWKLHGSSNFFSAGIQASQGIAYSTGVVFDAGIQALPDSNRVIEHCLVETGLAPIMCLYMEGKPTSVSPSAIKRIQEQWTEAVSTAKAIFCIGVNPHLPDEHIWNPLAKTQAKLYFIGDENNFSQWSATNRSQPAQFLGSRFGEAYRHLLERIDEI